MERLQDDIAAGLVNTADDDKRATIEGAVAGAGGAGTSSGIQDLQRGIREGVQRLERGVLEVQQLERRMPERIQRLEREMLEDLHQMQRAVASMNSLMRLFLLDQLGPASHSSEPSLSEVDYRTNALNYYHPDIMATGTPATLPCMLMGDLDAQEVVAGHIYPPRWSRSVRKAMKLDIHQPNNALLLVKAAQKRFNEFKWTLKPLPPVLTDETGQLCQLHPFKVLVLHPDLLRDGSSKELIAGHTGKQTKWSDVHGKLLHFSSDRMPSKRACSLHATLAIQYAQFVHWLGPEDSRLSAEDLRVDNAAWPWGSPAFDRDRISAFLQDSAAVAAAATVRPGPLNPQEGQTPSSD